MAVHTTTDITEPPYVTQPYSQAYLNLLQQQIFPGAQLVQTPQKDQYGRPVYQFQGGALPSYGTIRPQDQGISSLDQKVAPLNATQDLGIYTTMLRAMQGNPILKNAENQVLATGEGYYMNPASNPWLQDTFNQAARGVADQYRYATAPQTASQFARAGSFGGSAQQQTEAMQRFDLGQNLAGLANQIYGQNYQQERARQLQTIPMVPSLLQQDYVDPTKILGVGELLQSQQQQQLDAFRANQMARYQYPFDYLNQLGAGLGLSAARGSQTIQTTPDPNAGNTAAQYLAGGLGLLGLGSQLAQPGVSTAPQPQPQAGNFAGSLAYNPNAGNPFTLSLGNA